MISPDGVAPSRIVDVSASVIFPCTIKFRRRFLLLTPADPGGPGKRAVKRLCVLCISTCIVIYSVMYAITASLSHTHFCRATLCKRGMCCGLCLSVRLSVLPSHAGIVSKWLNLGPCKHCCTIAQGLQFPMPKIYGKLDGSHPQ